MPTAKQIYQSISEKLTPIYGKQESDALAFRVLEEIFGITTTDLILDSELAAYNGARISEIVERLQKEEPIQHIFGKADFYGLEFLVNSNVLIPRPETEELVDWIVKLHGKESNLRILDIGTGSGCIPISLKKHLPISEVHAIDISEDALNIAKRNAESNQTEILFHKKDILTDDLADLPKFDLIVSNPPYVLELEKAEMSANVLNYDPKLALFVPDNEGLKFYERIAKLAKRKLTHGGSLYFEINERYGMEIVDLLNRLHYLNIQLEKDMQKKDRMVSGMNV